MDYEDIYVRGQDCEHGRDDELLRFGNNNFIHDERKMKRYCEVKIALSETPHFRHVADPEDARAVITCRSAEIIRLGGARLRVLRHF
jgi:hypothetical protein